MGWEQRMQQSGMSDEGRESFLPSSVLPAWDDYRTMKWLEKVIYPEMYAQQIDEALALAT